MALSTKPCFLQTLEAGRGGACFSIPETGISEFKASQCYIMRPSFKKQKHWAAKMAERLRTVAVPRVGGARL